jgi:1-acyl-sn-glycerol-3-phosphate acyltransferase
MILRFLYSVHGYGLFFGLIALLIVPAWIGYGWIALRGGKPHLAFQRLSREIFRLYFRTHPCYCGLQIEGKEHLEGVQAAVITPSHHSAMDYPLIASEVLDYQTLTNSGFARLPLMRTSSQALGVFYLGKRPDATRLARAYKHLSRTLQSRSRVIMFPEGTRSFDGSLGPFKPGAFRLALENRAPIVPVIIENSGEVLGKDSPLFRRCNKPVRIRFLPPIQSEQFHSAQQLSQHTRQIMKQAIEDGSCGT